MRWWPHLRAGFIALAIGLGLADGCPVPRNGAERRLAEQRLGPDLAAAVARLEGTRRSILEPVRPVSELFGLRQRWKLFAGAARRRYRMSIEVRAEGESEWRLAYRPHDGAHGRLAAQLAYRRMRGAWNPHTTYGIRGGYAPFADWVADALFAADPRAAAVRVQMERIELGPRGDYRATGTQVYPIVLTRADRARAHRRRGGR